ncbi:hypothetical protein DV737_g2711, partial [Chaetothyriales sp. CBS 132003]
MAPPPDLNSLPPSRSPASSPVNARAMQAALATDGDRQGNPLLRPRRSSTSLAAAASMNAADLSRRSSASNRASPHPSRMGSERRRSQIATNLSLNDSAIPGPGELSSHSHGQTLSALSPLGDIHNELEQEQEAQVNRMLQMIRDQQLQLDALRSSQPGDHPFPSPHPAIPPGQAPQPPRRSLSRNPSSANPSPALRPIHGNDVGSSSVDQSPSPLDIARRNSTRDESSFYQAETVALTRENQLLRQRIRELEKQVSELTAATHNPPPTPSSLATARQKQKAGAEKRNYLFGKVQ